MPLPAIWGPKLWAVLHGIGSRAGNSMAQTRRDEERELKWLFDHLETIVPCPECRDHIIKYRREHPLPRMASDYGRWIWAFHEAVNARLGKPSIGWSEDIGSSVVLTKAWAEFKISIKESLLTGSVRGDLVSQWRIHLQLWQGFCCVA